MTETDPAKRVDMANQVDKYMWEDVSTMPLYQRPQNTGVKKTLANYGSNGLASINWVNVGYAKK